MEQKIIDNKVAVVLCNYIGWHHESNYAEYSGAKWEIIEEHINDPAFRCDPFIINSVELYQRMYGKPPYTDKNAKEIRALNKELEKIQEDFKKAFIAKYSWTPPPIDALNVVYVKSGRLFIIKPSKNDCKHVADERIAFNVFQV